MRKSKSAVAVHDKIVINKIYFIRGYKVMLDRDLAELYGVETKQLKRQVNRNIERFPEDFMFELTKEELENWRCQTGTSNSDKMGLRYSPYAFTEQGVSMLSSVLNSKTAIDVNIQIIRIFTKIREILITHKDILLKLEHLEKKMIKQDEHIKKHENEIHLIFKAIKKLLNSPQPERKKIGYKTPAKKT